MLALLIPSSQLSNPINFFFLYDIKLDACVKSQPIHPILKTGQRKVLPPVDLLLVPMP